MKHASPNVILSLFALGVSAFALNDFPQADQLDPRAAKVGTVITITGKALGKQHVDEVYLTDHRFDMKVKVLEQSETLLKVRIPPFAKPGRLQLLILTAGDKPAYLEQPLYVQVEEGEPVPVEITSKQQPAQPVGFPAAKVANTVEIASIGTRIPVPSSPEKTGQAPVTAPTFAAPQVKREEPQTAPKPSASVPVSPSPAPASAATAAPVANSGDPVKVTQPRLIKRAPVQMPPLSSSTGGDGNVELLVQIRTDGKVGNIKVVRGNPLLSQAAVRSVREWVYESAYVGSNPVPTEITVVLNFKR
jgi:TonB family protein